LRAHHPPRLLLRRVLEPQRDAEAMQVPDTVDQRQTFRNLGRVVVVRLDARAAPVDAVLLLCVWSCRTKAALRSSSASSGREGLFESHRDGHASAPMLRARKRRVAGGSSGTRSASNNVGTNSAHARLLS